MEEELAEELNFETQTDIITLLENVKCEGINQSGLKQALLALSTICSSSVESQDYFRLAGGVKDISTLLENNSCPRPAIPAAFFCLACAVKKNVVSQNLVLKEQFLVAVQKFLAYDEEKIVHSAAFFVACAVAYNGRGQQLAEETGCLKELLNILRRYLSNGQADDSQWLVITKAVAICINNPQNERNQGLCCCVLPLALKFLCSDQALNSGLSHVLTLISSMVANNTPNQNRLRQCGGLEQLVNLVRTLAKYPVERRSSTSVLAVSALDACIADNACSSIEVGNLGMISMIFKLMEDVDLETTQLKPLLLTVAHILEAHKKFISCVTEGPAHDQLIHLLTTSQDEELFTVLKYIFTLCRRKDEEELEDLNENVSIGHITRNWMETMNGKLEGLFALVQHENSSNTKHMTDKSLKITQPVVSNLNLQYTRHSADHDLQPSGRHLKEKETPGHDIQTSKPVLSRRKYSEYAREDRNSHVGRGFSRFNSEQDLRNPQASFRRLSSSTLVDDYSRANPSLHDTGYSSNALNDETNRGHAVAKSKHCASPSHAGEKGDEMVYKNHGSLIYPQHTGNYNKGFCSPANQAQGSNYFVEKPGFREDKDGSEECRSFLNSQFKSGHCGQHSMGFDAIANNTNNSFNMEQAGNRRNHLGRSCDMQTGHSSHKALYSPVSSYTKEEQDPHCYQDFARQQELKLSQNQRQPVSHYTSGSYNGPISVRREDITHKSNTNNWSKSVRSPFSYNNMHSNSGRCDSVRSQCPSATHSHESSSGRNDRCITLPQGNLNNNYTCSDYNYTDHTHLGSNASISHTSDLRGNLDFNNLESCTGENPYRDADLMDSLNGHMTSSNQSCGHAGIGPLYESQLNLLKHFQTLCGTLMSHISGAVSSKQTIGETNQAKQTSYMANSFNQRKDPTDTGSLSSSSSLRLKTKDTPLTLPVEDSKDGLPSPHSSTTDYFLDSSDQNKDHHVKSIEQANGSFQVITNYRNSRVTDSVTRVDETVVGNEIVKIVAKEKGSTLGCEQKSCKPVQPSMSGLSAFVKPSGIPKKPAKDVKTPFIRRAKTPQNFSCSLRMTPTPSQRMSSQRSRSFTHPPASPALSAFDLNLQEIARGKSNCLTKSTSMPPATICTTPRKENAICVKEINRQTPNSLFSVRNVTDEDRASPSSQSLSSRSDRSSESPGTTKNQGMDGKMDISLDAQVPQQYKSSHSVCQQENGKARKLHATVTTSVDCEEVCLSEEVQLCPGCAPGQNLNSRTFNIAIETSPNTCSYHRAVRQAEREEILKQLKSPGKSGIRSYKDVADNSPGCKRNKSDVYILSSDDKESLSSPELDESMASVQQALTKRALRRGSLKEMRRPRVPYTDAEVSNLEEGVRKMGRHWQQILFSYEFHPSRTSIDLKDKYKKLNKPLRNKFKRPSPALPFSMCEIRRLKRGVKMFGYNWKAILAGSKFLPGRTARALRDKWKLLNKATCKP